MEKIKWNQNKRKDIYIYCWKFHFKTNTVFKRLCQKYVSKWEFVYNRHVILRLIKNNKNNRKETLFVAIKGNKEQQEVNITSMTSPYVVQEGCWPCSFNCCNTQNAPSHCFRRTQAFKTYYNSWHDIYTSAKVHRNNCIYNWILQKKLSRVKVHTPKTKMKTNTWILTAPQN